FHFARGVGHDLVAGIELHAVARIGEDFGDQSFELDQLFFSHVYLQIDRRLAWPLGAVGAGVRTLFAVQVSDALHAFGPLALRLGAAVRRTRFLPVGLVAVGLRMAIITTAAAVAARAFRTRRGFISAAGMGARGLAGATMLRRRRRRFAMSGRAAVFPRQADTDQLFDVAQIGQFLAARDQRDRDALGAGARGAADAVDIGLRNVRKVEIDHMADAVDVDAAGGNVGGDQRADFAGAEGRQHALPVVLRLVAVDGVGGDAGPGEALHHLVGAVL